MGRIGRAVAGPGGVVAVFALVSIALAGEGPALPAGWEEMEIEAKWDLTAGQYKDVLAYYSDRSERHGLTARVRWSGVPRKFVDVYYDDKAAGGTLSGAQHVLRHRTRYSSTGLTSASGLEALIGATWTEDWQRVQYKSDPCRVAATWFRTESGDCNIADASNEQLCPGGAVKVEDLLRAESSDHAALQALRKDHHDLRPSALVPVLTVVDYRYRVELRNDKTPVYEISLDRIVENDSAATASHELEIELLEKPTRPAVDKLLAIAAELQEQFHLKPSLRSKGGTKDVDECKAPTAPGTPR